MSSVVVRRDGELWWVGLNRPDRRNAHDEAMVAEFDAVLTQASASILLIHSTTPGIFAAGADIREMRERGSDHALRAINAGLFERLEAHRWPTIALVDGPALGGGCEMALACDFRIASPRAVFAQPELSLGILAGAGGNWRLAQLVGLGAARRMLLAGVRLDAAEALARASRTRSRTISPPAASPSPRPSRNAPGGPLSSPSWRCARTARTPSSSTPWRRRCCSTAPTSTSA